MTLSLHEEAELLRRVPMFSKLEPSKLKLLAFTSESLTYEDGEVLFHRGDPADSAYVIMEGAVDVLSDIDDGAVVATTLRANELFGELGVITNETRSATLRASGTLQALRISEEIFLKLLADNAEVALDVMRQLSLKLTRTHRQYEDAQRELARYRAQG